MDFADATCTEDCDSNHFYLLLHFRFLLEKNRRASRCPAWKKWFCERRRRRAGGLLRRGLRADRPGLGGQAGIGGLATRQRGASRFECAIEGVDAGQREKRHCPVQSLGSRGAAASESFRHARRIGLGQAGR
ncbi:hypothetical protein [Phytopseudomonas dryadis]|uniref:hypothetical protein n=1 Tax=Pseudomonadaceae TaxID=135621 RepID=UPI0013F15CF6|nr:MULTISPECIES: hypothetical protein [Pseudomonas]